MTIRAGTVTDPGVTVSGSFRVFRGGSWDFYALFCRSSYRFFDTPGKRLSDLGFRLLRTVP